MELESLTRWGEVPPPGDDALAEALLDDTAAVPFPVNEELNFKLALWQGDLTKLKVDAIVNCSNEDLNERSGVSGQLFAAAGPQLEEACSKLGGCAPGDVKATRGFKLPAKHVLHAVPPRWRDGGGAEAALAGCYARCFEMARKLQCATVAFACLKSKDAPREEVAHVTLRALRTLLEGADGKGMQLAVLAMRPQDVYDTMIYENLMPLYFPRSPGEEHDAARLLPLHHEKIGAAAPPPPPAATATGGAALGAYEPNPALAALTQPPAAGAALVANGGGGYGAPGMMGGVAASIPLDVDMPPAGSAYAAFLQRAGLADLSDLEAMQLFYRAGVDPRGRPVFVFWAGHLPARKVRLARARRAPRAPPPPLASPYPPPSLLRSTSSACSC